MESVFEISLCMEELKVKFANYTLADAALPSWNNHMKTTGISSTNAISWTKHKRLMIEEYFLHEEMQKLEQKLWNLTMKEVDGCLYQMF